MTTNTQLELLTCEILKQQSRLNTAQNIANNITANKPTARRAARLDKIANICDNVEKRLAILLTKEEKLRDRVFTDDIFSAVRNDGKAQAAKSELDAAAAVYQTTSNDDDKKALKKALATYNNICTSLYFNRALWAVKNSVDNITLQRFIVASKCMQPHATFTTKAGIIYGSSLIPMDNLLAIFGLSRIYLENLLAPLFVSDACNVMLSFVGNSTAAAANEKIHKIVIACNRDNNMSVSENELLLSNKKACKAFNDIFTKFFGFENIHFQKKHHAAVIQNTRFIKSTTANKFNFKLAIAAAYYRSFYSAMVAIAQGLDPVIYAGKGENITTIKF